MFCSNCGHELEEGSNFCKNCGAQVKSTPKDISPVSRPVNEADELYEAGMIAKETNNFDQLKSMARALMLKYPKDYRGYYLMLYAFEGIYSDEIYYQGQYYNFNKLVDMALALATTKDEKNQIRSFSNAHTTIVEKTLAVDSYEKERELKRREISNHIEKMEKKNRIVIAVILGIFVLLAIICFSTGDSSAPASGIMSLIMGGAIAFFVGENCGKKIEKYKREVGYYDYFGTPV